MPKSLSVWKTRGNCPRTDRLKLTGMMSTSRKVSNTTWKKIGTNQRKLLKVW
eukprot:CAMPEP_0116893934 /NCGR_PEP_ID=MMETSP0467-20121206/3825_1 /TAXON_ID=283647 /ORGANISM="Mesodinium pulex, Strain SPMC105" /LENGTH=51 /DNA_ID=CAMNT_0004563895 /DNA_START=1505 /DNA_END=1657 /DNA_ORIENTATION=-